jgi:hypothetical protein
MTWFPDSKQIIFIGRGRQSLYRLSMDETEFVKLPVAVKGLIQDIYLIP